MIVGIGTDIVDIARLERALERSKRLPSRIFTPNELGLPTASLAGRFAAKEAVAKALGSPGDLSWQDVEVTSNEHGKPELSVTGACARRASALGVTNWHISISHDGGLAVAFVVAEST